MGSLGFTKRINNNFKYGQSTISKHPILRRSTPGATILSFQSIQVNTEDCVHGFEKPPCTFEQAILRRISNYDLSTVVDRPRRRGQISPLA